MKRDISIGLVELLSGEYYEFTKDYLPTESSIEHTLFASFSWPGIFPPAEEFGGAYIDGSSVYDLDIYTAVNKCLDMGFAEEDIVIDAILSTGSTINKVDGKELKAVGMLLRYLSINSFYNSMDGVLRAKFAYPKANFRYVVAPT